MREERALGVTAVFGVGGMISVEDWDRFLQLNSSHLNVSAVLDKLLGQGYTITLMNPWLELRFFRFQRFNASSDGVLHVD